MHRTKFNRSELFCYAAYGFPNVITLSMIDYSRHGFMPTKPIRHHAINVAAAYIDGVQEQTKPALHHAVL